MERTGLLKSLGSKLAPSKNEKDSTPFVLKLIITCQKYNIPYELMCRLNYYDLLYLVVEYQIESLKENLKLQAKARQDSMNVEVREATNEDILRMHPRGESTWLK